MHNGHICKSNSNNNILNVNKQTDRKKHIEKHNEHQRSTLKRRSIKYPVLDTVASPKTNINTVSKATLGGLLRDGPVLVWALRAP